MTLNQEVDEWIVTNPQQAVYVTSEGNILQQYQTLPQKTTEELGVNGEYG